MVKKENAFTVYEMLLLLTLFYAFCELPNSRIFPITVSLIASRIGAKIFSWIISFSV